MSSTPVIVYGRTACQACRLTKNKLDAAGVPLTYVDLDDDHDALDGLTDQDWVHALPVVITPDDRWCGLDRDHIRDTIATYGTAA